MTSLVEINHLSFSRNGRPIFRDVSFSLQRGKVTGILGPSGTGKTTLLRLIGAELKPDHGTVVLDGHNMNALKRKTLYQVRRGIGMLFQTGALFTNLSVFENVAFPLREHTQLSEPLIRSLVLMKLQAVGLRGASDLMPSELSGGMARRVALARAIVMDPKLIMYDEPFTGLDPIAMGVIVKLVRELNDVLELTTVLVSHDVEQTMLIADDIYIISGGKVIAHGAPHVIMNHKDPEVHQFIHGLPDGKIPFDYPARSYEEDLFV